VLLYTLEGFQRHPDIDEITLVCLDGWQNVVDTYAHQFNIDKLARVVPGGASGQESNRNGVFALEGVADPDDLVVIHDGIRPLVDDHVLSDVVRVAREKGNAVTSLPYNEQIFVVTEDDPTTTRRFIPRETLRRVSTPQAYRFGELDAAYHEAFERGVGIDGSHYTNTMMVVLGHTLNFADGSDRNIKLTTRDDLEMFKAYLAMDRDDWLK
jgi:2-C-methyl-D-erythritol 4-phosphate cytidylyltransferase